MQSCYLLHIPWVEVEGKYCVIYKFFLTLCFTCKTRALPYIRPLQWHCCRIQANYVIMACYNAITELDPSDCLFKKQREWEGGGAVSHPGVGNMGWATNRWLTDPQKLSPTTLFNKNPERPIRFAFDLPIRTKQPITNAHGRALRNRCCGSNVGLRNDHTEKKKTKSRKEKSHGGGAQSGGGGLYQLVCWGFVSTDCTW